MLASNLPGSNYSAAFAAMTAIAFSSTEKIFSDSRLGAPDRIEAESLRFMFTIMDCSKALLAVVADINTDKNTVINEMHDARLQLKKVF